MDPGLFETVKTTLTALQEEQEEPLLMTVFGGHLSEVTNCESPLIQSIKHVIENTDPNSTLIVLTGYCPEETTEHEFGHKHELRRVHEREYGRGRKFRQGHGHKRERNSKRQPKVVHINESSNGGHHENATIPVFARGKFIL